jgi:hypothetical protein
MKDLICKICEQGSIIKQNLLTWFVYKGEKKQLNLKSSACDYCGEEDGSVLDFNNKLIKDWHKKIDAKN